MNTSMKQLYKSLILKNHTIRYFKDYNNYELQEPRADEGLYYTYIRSLNTVIKATEGTIDITIEGVMKTPEVNYIQLDFEIGTPIEE